MKWYLVQTRPREEFRAEENLMNQGYSVFLPTMSIQKISKKLVNIQKVPLFSRYLFIQLDQVNSNWYPIRSTRGVTQMVRFGLQSEPIEIPELVIENIRCLTQGATQPKALFAQNTKVVVLDGPFKSLEGYFQRMATESQGELRAHILIEMMGKVQRIKIEPQLIRETA